MCVNAIRRWPLHKAPRQTRTDPFSHLPKTALKEPIFGDGNWGSGLIVCVAEQSGRHARASASGGNLPVCSLVPTNHMHHTIGVP